MDYDEFDSYQPRDADYMEEDDSELVSPPDQPGVTVSLSWQQILFIIAVNAILSLIISLVVVIIAGSRLPSLPGAPVPAGPVVAEAELSPIVEATSETGQAQPSPSETVVTSTGATTPIARTTPSEALATATPVEPTVYAVQLGDTLGSIARAFEVSLEDLMAANGITNADYVQVGQELIIPIGGLPSATPTLTPVPIPTDTPLPFNPPTPLPSGTGLPAEPAATVGPTPTPVPTLTPASGSEIRLFLEVFNPGDLASERLQIVNQGAFVRLAGWTLSDGAGNVYTFPDFSLWGGGAINVHTTGGSNTTTDLYWGQPNAIWEVGDQVMLSDADGTTITVYTVPAP